MIYVLFALLALGAVLYFPVAILRAARRRGIARVSANALILVSCAPFILLLFVLVLVGSR